MSGVFFFSDESTSMIGDRSLRVYDLEAREEVITKT